MYYITTNRLFSVKEKLDFAVRNVNFMSQNCLLKKYLFTLPRSFPKNIISKLMLFVAVLFMA